MGTAGGHMQLPDALSTKRRLQSLFLFHSAASVSAGLSAFLMPSLWAVLFADGTLDSLDGGAGTNVALFMIRLYGALLASQGYLVYSIRTVDDGQVKRAFVMAYFGCFAGSLLAVIYAHSLNDGTM